MQYVVIAFDPGPHTGIAVFAGGELVMSATVVVENRKLTESVYRVISSTIDQYVGYAWPDVVVERFHTHSAAVGSGWSGVITSMLCGFIHGYAVLKDCDVIWQNSVDRKAFEDEAKCKPHATVHEVSAIAHGLCYLRRSMASAGQT